MTIQEAGVCRRELEQTIGRLIEDFVNATGLQVCGINGNTKYDESGKATCTRVNVKVELPAEKGTSLSEIFAALRKGKGLSEL